MTIELTDSQKIILAPIADALGCEATLPVVLETVSELRTGYKMGMRAFFTALGELPHGRIDEAISRLMARAPRK
jgi:hypothetical protein